MTDIESVRAHVEILRYCRAKKRELEQMETHSRAAVEEALGDNEIGELDGQPAVRNKYVKSRRLNQTVLKERFNDVREECMDVVETRRFEVL